MRGRGQDDLKQLAEAAGLQVKWQDAHGKPQTVQPDTLRTVLQHLGLPCATPEQCRDSMGRLSDESGQQGFGAQAAGRKNLQVVHEGESVVLQRQGSTHYRLELEGGKSIMGTARDLGNGRVSIPGISQPGYHRLEMGGVHCTLAVSPRRCPSVASLLARHDAAVAPKMGAKPWALSAQVYGLCREADGRALPGWEVGGDYSLVGRLAVEAAGQGACGLAISPVHAMFSADLGHYSPYSPSSRLFLNAVYADPQAVFDADFLRPLLNEPRQALRDAGGCLDWPAIQAIRLRQLRRLFEQFETAQPEALQRDFEIFRSEAGEALDNHAAFEALHAHFSAKLGPGHGWRDWPDAYHDPRSQAVQRFCADHRAEVRFHAFLQWLAARSLGAAQQTARSHMPLGLIADMAVGTDPRGSHAWSRQDQIMTALSVGAPPDIFQPSGQDWGLTAFSPHALQQNGYEGFIETLRASLAYAGGIRVDHVIGLARVWLVPEGASAADGVYISFPREDMLDLVALESWRHAAVAVGENLGTVPGDFNEAIYRRGILGMSVLWFEQEGSEPASFKPPQAWPVESMAMASTHDLPTLRGWWSGRDIDWRVRQGEFDDAESSKQRAEREQQKRALWRALQNCDLAASDAAVPAEAPAREILAFLAKTPSAVLNVALEDLLGNVEQPNLPGACPAEDPEDRHPNWRRPYDLPVEGALQSDEAQRLLSALRSGDIA